MHDFNRLFKIKTMTKNLKCIKCDKSELDFQQDSRGCEYINIIPHSPEDSAVFLCSECISKFQYSKDIKNNYRIGKINLLEHPNWDKNLDRNSLQFEMLIKIHQLIDKWESLMYKFKN